MKIRLYPPFQVLGGDIIEMHLEKDLTLLEFCGSLAHHFPRVLDFLPPNDRRYEALLANVFFVNNNNNPAKILCPSDTVRNEDFLQLLPPFDGG